LIEERLSQLPLAVISYWSLAIIYIPDRARSRVIDR